jgi:hypothetical protein
VKETHRLLRSSLQSRAQVRARLAELAHAFDRSAALVRLTAPAAQPRRAHWLARVRLLHLGWLVLLLVAAGLRHGH